MGDHHNAQSCYATELLDDAWKFRFVSRREALFLFKLNLLFFDSLCQGAATLLSHPVLHDLERQEPESMAELFSSGALRPIFFDETDTFQNVAAEMIRDGTPRW